MPLVGRWESSGLLVKSPGIPPGVFPRAHLAPISHKCVASLFCDVRLPRRIALRCVDALSSTGFSLWSVDEPQLKPHRLKPVLRDRARPGRGKSGWKLPQSSCEKCGLRRTTIHRAFRPFFIARTSAKRKRADPIAPAQILYIVVRPRAITV